MTNDLGVWKAEDCTLVLIDTPKDMFGIIRSEASAELIELHVRLLAKPPTRSTCSRPLVSGSAPTDPPTSRFCPSSSASSRSTDGAVLASDERFNAMGVDLVVDGGMRVW